jgi:hypothetical protein
MKRKPAKKQAPWMIQGAWHGHTHTDPGLCMRLSLFLPKAETATAQSDFTSICTFLMTSALGSVTSKMPFSGSP